MLAGRPGFGTLSPMVDPVGGTTPDDGIRVRLDPTGDDGLVVSWELGADTARRWGAPPDAAVAGYDLWVCLDDQCIPWKGRDRLWAKDRLRLPWDVVGQSVEVALELRVVAEWADGTRSEPMSAPFVVPPRYALAATDAWEVGEPEVIVEDGARRAAGLTYWPDGGIGFATIDGRTYGFASNGPRVARWRVDEDRFLGALLAAGEPIAGVGADVAYASGSSVYVDPASAAVLLFFHEEIHPGGDELRFWSAIGLAVSRDGGRTFESRGRIISPNIEVDDPRRVALTEVGGAPFIVEDGYFHIYFRETLASGEALNLGVARAPVDLVVAAALDGSLLAWHKHRDGAWDEPGLGGVASELLPGAPTPRWFDVIRMDADGCFVLIFSDGMADEWGYGITTSTDGLHWATPARLGEIERGGERLYLSLASPELRQPKTAPGEVIHLYRTRSQRGGSGRWEDAVVERRALRRLG